MQIGFDSYVSRTVRKTQMKKKSRPHSEVNEFILRYNPPFLFLVRSMGGGDADGCRATGEGNRSHDVRSARSATRSPCFLHRI